jgi:DNA polymerase-3 subunit delta
MLEVKEGLDAGLRAKALARAVGAHEFRVQKAAKFAASYSEKELRRILINAFETDARIKSGLLDDKLALEMLIAEI